MRLLAPERHNNHPGRVSKNGVGNFKRRKKMLSVSDVKAVLNKFFEEVELNQGKQIYCNFNKK